jgi:peptide/nickel transport system permease protein
VPVVDLELGADHEVALEQLGATPRAWRALRRNPNFWIGAIGVILIVGAAIFAPFISSHGPDQQFRREGLTARGDPVGPNAEFPLGTDKLGRDYLSRLLYGARTSLTVGVGANLLATIIGVAVGSVAGFAGSPRIRLSLGRGRGVEIPLPVETVLMRITDAVLSFPALLLAIALVAVSGPSLGLVIFVIAAILWTGIARIVYSRVLVIRESDYIQAARAVGVGPVRILARHVGPHLISIVLVYATLGIASTVLFEATLSFLGVGVPPPAPSWGGMIFEHIGYYKSDPRVVILPGLAIMLTILSFNLLGDALADALDPYHWQ